VQSWDNFLWLRWSRPYPGRARRSNQPCIGSASGLWPAGRFAPIRVVACAQVHEAVGRSTLGSHAGNPDVVAGGSTKSMLEKTSIRRLANDQLGRTGSGILLLEELVGSCPSEFKECAAAYRAASDMQSEDGVGIEVQDVLVAKDVTFHNLGLEGTFQHLHVPFDLACLLETKLPGTLSHLALHVADQVAVRPRKEPDCGRYGSVVFRSRHLLFANAAARPKVVAEAEPAGKWRACADLKMVDDEGQQGVSEATVNVRPEQARDRRSTASALESLVDAMLTIRDQAWKILGRQCDIEVALVRLEPHAVGARFVQLDQIVLKD
jgi:hypothetical protein